MGWVEFRECKVQYRESYKGGVCTGWVEECWVENRGGGVEYWECSVE
jgi:hypothetical protein